MNPILSLPHEFIYCWSAGLKEDGNIKKKYEGITSKWSKSRAESEMEQDKYRGTEVMGVMRHIPLKNGIVVIDIDVNCPYMDVIQQFPCLKNTLYVKGNTKGWHFYMHYDWHKNSVDVLDGIQGDVCGEKIFEREDKEWSKDPIKTLTKEEFSTLVKEPFFPKEPKLVKSESVKSESVEKLLPLIDIQYLDNRTDWLKIVFACKKSGISEDVVRTLSQKSDHYTSDGFEYAWSSYDTDSITATERTLHYYAKKSNEMAYYEICEEEVMDIQRLIQMKPPELINPTETETFKELNKEAQAKRMKKYDADCDANVHQEMKMKSAYFEQFHFKVMTPSCFGRKAYNKVSLVSSREIDQQYENVWVDGDLFTSKWKRMPSIRTYENVDFLPFPKVCPSYTMNTFNGLRAERLHGSGDFSRILHHIDILTGHEGTDYLLNYLAHMVQRPGELPRVALVFQSEQGVGKNVFFENFANKVLGNEYLLQTAEMDKVIGRFSMVNNKLMVIMDETSGKDSFMNSDKIKNIITAEQIAWERKGIDGININNCGRYLFFSNNFTPVKIEHSDRRYVVYKCTNEVQNNEDYFKALLKDFQDDGVVRSFYEFLMKRNIQDWNSIRDRPITKAYEDIQSVNVPPMAHFLEKLIMQYEEKTPEDQVLFKKIASNDLYTYFTDWLVEYGYKKLEYNYTKFGREVKEYEGIEKKRLSNGMIYSLDFETLKTYLVKRKWIETV
jgi:hypothetical protein